jgi:hypothetical protein
VRAVAITQDPDPFEPPAPPTTKSRAARLAIERADIRWMLEGPRGCRILWELLVHGGMGTSVFSLGVTRDLDLAYAAGRRDTAEQLLDLIRRHASDLYPRLMAEQLELARAIGNPIDDHDHGTLAEHAAR